MNPRTICSENGGGLAQIRSGAIEQLIQRQRIAAGIYSDVLVDGKAIWVKAYMKPRIVWLGTGK